MRTLRYTPPHVAGLLTLDSLTPAAWRDMPNVWRSIAHGTITSTLGEGVREGYVAAARLYRATGAPLAMEALMAIGTDLADQAYPDFDKLKADLGLSADRTYRPGRNIRHDLVMATAALYAEFGRAVPASLYKVLLASGADTAQAGGLYRLFAEPLSLKADRLADAVLHGVLLVTPVGMRLHSLFSQYRLQFDHYMNCGCVTGRRKGKPFDYELPARFKDVALQNVIAAALEQYGVRKASYPALGLSMAS